MCEETQSSEASGFSSEAPFPLAETEHKVHTGVSCAHLVPAILFPIKNRKEDSNLSRRQQETRARRN